MRAVTLTAVSFGLAIAAVVFLLVWPVYSGFNNAQPTRATLLQVNGPHILIPVMLPVFVTGIPLLFRKQSVRITAAILMVGFAIISGFSIGLFYLPAAAVMVLAACAPEGRGGKPTV
jgi:hypothetical protein